MALAAMRAAPTLLSNHPAGSNRTRNTRSNPDDAASDSVDDDVDLDEEDDAWMNLPDGIEVHDEADNGREDTNPSIVEDTSARDTVADYIKELNWRPEVIEPGPVPPFVQGHQIRDDVTRLKRGFARTFGDPMKCLAKVTGFDYAFVARLTRKSNVYAQQHICWSKFTRHELRARAL